MGKSTNEFINLDEFIEYGKHHPPHPKRGMITSASAKRIADNFPKS